jgi:hypothetical protein
MCVLVPARHACQLAIDKVGVCGATVFLFGGCGGWDVPTTIIIRYNCGMYCALWAREILAAPPSEANGQCFDWPHWTSKQMKVLRFMWQARLDEFCQHHQPLQTRPPSSEIPASVPTPASQPQRAATLPPTADACGADHQPDTQLVAAQLANLKV